MLIGNLMLIVLNVPLISLFVQLLRLPGSILAPLIIVFCVVGAYTLSNNVVEVIIMIGFGIAGYLMRKVDLDPAPLVLAFVLGNIFETNFRQALLVGKGTLSLFYTRPIAALLVACCVALIALQVGRTIVGGGAFRRLGRAPRRPNTSQPRVIVGLAGSTQPTAGMPQPRLSNPGCSGTIVGRCPTLRPPHRPASSLPGPRRRAAKAGCGSSPAPRSRSWWWR